MSPGQDVLLERRDDLAVALIGHVGLTGQVAGRRTPDGGERRGGGRSDRRGHGLERFHPAVIAAGGDMGHQDQPLLPMVEHHRAVDDQEPDGGNRRRRGIGHRMAVEQLGCFEGEVAHQPAGERWKARQARGPQRPRDPDQPFAYGPSIGHVDRDRPRSSGDLDAVGTGDDRRCRVAGHERVPAPSFRTLHGLEQDPRTVTRQCREQSHRRRDVGQEFGPHGNQGPLGRERVERLAIGTDLQFHDEPPRNNERPRTIWPGVRGGAVVMRWLRTRGRRALGAPAPDPTVATRRHGRRL